MRLYEFDAKKQAEEDFEKILFGTVKQSDENDTKIESSIYQKILNFLEDPSPENKEDAYKALTYLKKFENVFPNDLKPNSNIIYRGGIVSNEEMSKKILDIVNTRNQEIIEIPYTYKSKSNIQSWTSDIDVGWLFANKSNYSKHYKKRNHNKDIPVVIAANLDNTFILSSKLTNLICKHFNANLESEIIRISDDPIKCKIYIDPSHISLYQHVKTHLKK